MARQRKRLTVAVIYNVPQSPAAPRSLDVLSEAAVEQEADGVERALRRLGHRPVLVALGSLIRDARRVASLGPDLVFNLCEGYRGDAGKEMCVAGLWELLGLAYTGNTPLALGVAQNKVLAKQLFQAAGIPTPAFRVCDRVPRRIDLDYPLIVKPAHEDASLGITRRSVVHDDRQLARQVRAILKAYRQPALVEQFIGGREFNVSILGGERPRCLPISEISFAAVEAGAPHITSYEAKWVEDDPLYAQTPPVCPARLPAGLRRELRRRAIDVWALCGGRDYGRVDFRVDRAGRIFVLELNPNPDISENAGYARAVRASGMTYDDFVERLIEQALRRKGRDRG